MRWLLAKDLRILRRSPLLVAMLVVYPIVIAALVGFAVTSGPSKPRVALLNQVPKDKTRVSLGGERVNVAQEAKPLFDAITVVRVKTEAEAIAKVRSGDVLAALVLPADITQQLQEATSGTGTRPIRGDTLRWQGQAGPGVVQPILVANQNRPRHEHPRARTRGAISWPAPDD